MNPSTPLVFKFGGASVRDVESIRNVAAIISNYAERPMVVVVSAMGKTTNALEKIVSHWQRADLEQAREETDQLWDAHLEIVEHLFDDIPQGLKEDMFAWRAEVLGQLNEVAISYSQQYDAIVHKGELLSTRIIAAFINQMTPTVWKDTRKLVKTDSHHRRATVLWEETVECIIDHIEKDKVNLVQGFIGSDPKGIPTTLGREGSDYTGAVFAYALGADSLTIWKDVSGMLNGDPKKFESLQKINVLPYDEAIELAFYGASIIHPKTIQPLKKAQIPLFIKSFVNPVAKGTVITQADYPEPHIPNYILKERQALLSLSTKDLAFIAEHHLSEVYALFAREGVVVNLMQNRATKAQFSINDDPVVLPKVVEQLQHDFDIKWSRGLQLLTIRHYTGSDIAQHIQNKIVMLEQRTPETLQIVFKN